MDSENTKFYTGIKIIEIERTPQKEKTSSPSPQSVQENPVQATAAQTHEFELQSRTCDQANAEQILV